MMTCKPIAPGAPRRLRTTQERVGHISITDEEAIARGKLPATARHGINRDERMNECAGDCCNRICTNCRVTCDRCSRWTCPECAFYHVSIDGERDEDTGAIDYLRLCTDCAQFVTNDINLFYVQKNATEAAPECFPAAIQHIKPYECVARRTLTFDDCDNHVAVN